MKMFHFKLNDKMENTNKPNMMQLEFAQRIDTINRQKDDEMMLIAQDYEQKKRRIEFERYRKINEVKIEQARWQDEYRRSKIEEGQRAHREKVEVCDRLEALLENIKAVVDEASER